MEKKEIKYHGKLENTAFDELKKKHGDVWTITIPLNDESNEHVVCYIKKPDRALVGRTWSLWKMNPVQATEVVFETNWLCGDDRIRTNDDLFYSAMLEIDGSMEVRKAVLKKN